MRLVREASRRSSLVYFKSVQQILALREILFKLRHIVLEAAMIGVLARIFNLLLNT